MDGIKLVMQDEPLIETLKDSIKEQIDEYREELKGNPEIELAQSICDNFTRLLISLTPYKSRTYVESNCNKVTKKIISEVMMCKIQNILENIKGGK